MTKKKISALGKVILKRLVDIEKNQNWLAESVGTTPERISSYVTGRSVPSVITLYNIAAVLNVDSSALINAIMQEKRVS